MEWILPYQLALAFPFMLAGALYGWQRGAREEAITTSILLGAVLFFGSGRLAADLGRLINRIGEAFAHFFSAVLSSPIAARELVTESNQQNVHLVAFLLLVLFAYVTGGALAERLAFRSGSRLFGALLGAINAFLVASQLFGTIQRFFPRLFQEERTIRITPSSDANLLRSYLPSVFAVLVVVLLVVVFFRLPKIRQ